MNQHQMELVMSDTNNSSNHRPVSFDSVIGQEEIKSFLEMKIKAFRKTHKTIGHCLFLGPSGSGKTTLATVMANEMGVRIHSLMGPRLKTPGDIAAVFKNVQENDVVFIDEIHCLPRHCQDYLLVAMEDFKLAVSDKNLDRPVTIHLPQFTLIGATTHAGDIQTAMLTRFKYTASLSSYSVNQLADIVSTACKRQYNVNVPLAVANKIAKLSNRIPRKAYTILDNYMEVIEAKTTGKIVSADLDNASLMTTLKFMGIDPILGLDKITRSYLAACIRVNKPMGAKHIGSMINQQETTILNYIEPFLLTDIEFSIESSGVSINGPFIKIGKTGRYATENAHHYIKIMQQFQKKGWFTDENLRIKDYVVE